MVKGRYLFVKPDLEPQSVVAEMSNEDGELLYAFGESVLTLKTGLDAGVFFPRLENAKGKASPACEWCDVADACGKQESGVRRRLAGIAARARKQEEEGERVSPTESQLVRLWFLGEEKS